MADQTQKKIIISGANGSLGQAVVKRFLEEGYRVLAADRSGSRLDFAKTHKSFELHEVNFSDENNAGNFMEEAISMHGQIHFGAFLVGGFAMGDITKTGGEELHKMFAINFETAYFGVRPLFAHMLEKGYGRIILIGARPALKAEAGKSALAYALSKSLLFKLAEILNIEAKGKSVTINVFAPSTIDTPANRKSMPDADTSKWVKPEQIAESMAFICSDKSDVLRETVLKVYGES